MTRNEAYLTVVEGWLRNNRGIVFTEGAVDDLCDRIAPVLADNARLTAALRDIDAIRTASDWNGKTLDHAAEIARRALEPTP